MMRRWFFSLVDWLLCLVSANGKRSYSFAGTRFLTAADVKRIFPECIMNEGRSEIHSVPPLELEKTAFLLEGTNRDPAGLFKGYDIHMEAPFCARFLASDRRKLFAASGSLLVRDEKLGAFIISPESKVSKRLSLAFRPVSPESSVMSATTVSSSKACTFGDFGLAMLPKLARIAGKNHNGPVMLPSFPYVIQYLNLLQLEAVPPEIDFKQLIPIRESADVIFGPGVEDGFGSLRSDIDKLREIVLPLLPESHHKKVYFCRESRRRIVNEQELLPLFQQLGIESIKDDHVDVLKQAALFQGADFIVAPHGALLANLVYCKPGTVFVELLPGPFVAICYRNLCQTLGIHYHAIFCTRLDHYRNEAVGEDFHADPKRLCHAMETILNRCHSGRN